MVRWLCVFLTLCPCFFNHSIWWRMRTCLWFNSGEFSYLALLSSVQTIRAATENQLHTNRRRNTLRLPASKLLPISDEWFRVACLSNTSRQIHSHSCKMLRRDHRQKNRAAGKCSTRSVWTKCSDQPNICSFLWQNQPFIITWLASFEYSPHLISGCLNTTNAVYLDRVTNTPERDLGNDDNLSNSLSALHDGAKRKCLHQPRNSLAKLPGRKATTKKVTGQFHKTNLRAS